MALEELLLLLSVGHCVAAQWVVIVAGTKGYENYRHQADACHAYQIVKSNGVADDHIILMAYGDVAQDKKNPFEGQLFNHPAPNSTGRDVYAGCNIDHKGVDVTADGFLGILNGTGRGKVLKSSKDDNVFVFYSGMSAYGMIPFQDNSIVYQKQFQGSLQYMRTSNMFKKLVFYLEGGEIGSMFHGMHIPNIYAVTAGNGEESSYANYCPPDDVVNRKSLNACIGDLFSTAWMEDVDRKGTIHVTLQQQYERVKQRVISHGQYQSHVTQWGDLSFVGDNASDYLGAGPGNEDDRDWKSDASASHSQTNSYRASFTNFPSVLV